MKPTGNRSRGLSPGNQAETWTVILVTGMVLWNVSQSIIPLNTVYSIDNVGEWDGNTRTIIMNEADLDTTSELSNNISWVSRAVNIFVLSSLSLSYGLYLYNSGDIVFPALVISVVLVLFSSRLGESADFEFADVNIVYRCILVVAVLLAVLTAVVFDFSVPFPTVLLNVIVGGSATTVIILLYWSVE